MTRHGAESHGVESHGAARQAALDQGRRPALGRCQAAAVRAGGTGRGRPRPAPARRRGRRRVVAGQRRRWAGRRLRLAGFGVGRRPDHVLGRSRPPWPGHRRLHPGPPGGRGRRPRAELHLQRGPGHPPGPGLDHRVADPPRLRARHRRPPPPGSQRPPGVLAPAWRPQRLPRRVAGRTPSTGRPITTSESSPRSRRCRHPVKDQVTSNAPGCAARARLRCMPRAWSASSVLATCAGLRLRPVDLGRRTGSARHERTASLAAWPPQRW